MQGTVDGGTGDVTLRDTLELTPASRNHLRGRDVQLATAGAFANLAGPAAVDATERWLVYAATSAGSTFGRLDSGTAPRWNATYASVPPTAVTGTRYVRRAAAGDADRASRGPSDTARSPGCPRNNTAT